jgi:RecB family exonuclease
VIHNLASLPENVGALGQDGRVSEDGQLGFDGMPRRLFVCYPSRLITWLDCPRRYRMAYLDRPARPKGPPWAHNSLGASVHTALAGWWRLPVKRRTPTAAGALLEAGWIEEGYRDDAQSQAWRVRARDMVERYVAGVDPMSQPVGVERTVGFRSATMAVSGRLDRLDDRDGELVVVDYKTGRHVLTTDDARGSLALALYAVASGRVLRRECRRVELHHLPTGRVVVWEHSRESLDRQVDRAEAIAAEVQSAEEHWRSETVADPDLLFPARPGRQCGWCDFARHCPEGRAAAVPTQPWAGLAEDRERPADREQPAEREQPEAGEQARSDHETEGNGARPLASSSQPARSSTAAQVR